MRKKGSCRFKPYFKVEYYCETIHSWRVIQKAYPTKEKAEEAFTVGLRCRVIKTTEKGKEIV